MALMVVVTVLGLSWVAFKEQLYDQLIQGGAQGIGAQVSAGVRVLLAVLLIYLALSLVRIGYDNITNVRSGSEPAAKPSDD